MSREIDISQLARVVGAEVGQTVRAIKLELFSSVITLTRVGNPDGWQNPNAAPPGYVGGRLRGNWQTSVGSMADGELDRIDPTGSAAIDEAARTVTTDGVDYLTNNLPYAKVWDDHDGMVARSVARIERIVREKSRER